MRDCLTFQVTGKLSPALLSGEPGSSLRKLASSSRHGHSWLSPPLVPGKHAAMLTVSLLLLAGARCQ